MTRDRAFGLTSLYYAVLFMAIGAHLPYWPVWLESRGMSAGEIGAMLGLAVFARVLGATVFPAMADRYAIRRALLATSAVLAAGIIFLHLTAKSEGALLVLTLAMALFSAPLIPVGEALGLRAAQRYEFPYSRARAAGSFSFLAMVLVMGPAIDRFGPDAALYTIGACFLMAACAGLAHPGGGAAPGVVDQSRYRDMVALIRNRVFLIFALSAALGQAAHGVYYVYSALQWRAAGFSGGEIGALWAVGVAAEILLLFGPGHRWVARLGPVRALILAAGAGVVRWGLMVVEPSGPLLWLLQGLHALTFGMALLGTMAFVAAAIPRRLNATAQGISSGLLGGITLALVTLAAGAMAAYLPPGMLYLVAVVPACIALLAALVLRRVWDGGLLLT
ncbi:MFS transporter [Rhodobacteraceae bacterium NNCM2]|nr:MFS transporter [Coraliihabitans acroporae]